MEKFSEKDGIINSYRSLVEFLPIVLGPKCEIVLHLIEGDTSSIIAIKNGELTNRKVGLEKDEVGKRLKELKTNQDYIVHNIQKTSAGNDMKSNTFFIKDSAGEFIGMLCINMDISVPLAVIKYFEELLPADRRTEVELASAQNSVEGITLDIIESVIRNYHIPVERMTPDEKIDVLRRMKEKGVFRIRGAVHEIAKQLDTSEPTIYRYLKALE